MIGSLFSGIGGLELGLEWAGLGPVLWQVEADITRRVSHVDSESLSQTRRASALSDTRTHAERSAAVKTGNAVRSPAKRSEIARKAQAARDHEGHAEAMRRYWAQFTPEQRSEKARAREAGKTAEQRELAIAKGRAARERQLAKARRAA